MLLYVYNSVITKFASDYFWLSVGVCHQSDVIISLLFFQIPYSLFAGLIFIFFLFILFFSFFFFFFFECLLMWLIRSHDLLSDWHVYLKRIEQFFFNCTICMHKNKVFYFKHELRSIMYRLNISYGYEIPSI